MKKLLFLSLIGISTLFHNSFAVSLFSKEIDPSPELFALLYKRIEAEEDKKLNTPHPSRCREIVVQKKSRLIRECQDSMQANPKSSVLLESKPTEEAITTCANLLDIINEILEYTTKEIPNYLTQDGVRQLRTIRNNIENAEDFRKSNTSSGKTFTKEYAANSSFSETL